MFTFSELHGHSGVLETVPVNKSTSGIGKDYIIFFLPDFYIPNENYLNLFEAYVMTHT